MTNHKINITIIGMGKGGQALLKIFADVHELSGTYRAASIS